jgi:hypothetical protein
VFPNFQLHLRQGDLQQTGGFFQVPLRFHKHLLEQFHLFVFERFDFHLSAPIQFPGVPGALRSLLGVDIVHLLKANNMMNDI